MCGRYTLTRYDGIVEDLQAAIGAGVTASEWWKPRFNVAPTQPAPVVLLRDGVRTLELMKWGLVPHWAARERTAAGASPAKRPPLMINARVETLVDKPTFRDALSRRRCLVPADGFFEWQRLGGTPVPMYFHPGTPRLVAFAGLWARARTDAGEQYTFTIITGSPNELVLPIHDRMPVVLDPSTYAAWLDPAVDHVAARALLSTPAVSDWRAEPVSTWVNKADHEGPQCIERVPTADASTQTSLF